MIKMRITKLKIPSYPALLATILLCLKTCSADPIEKKLLDDVMKNYSVLERPVVDHRQPLVVNIKFILQQIVDVDERNQIITINAWLDLRWKNYLWEWIPEKYHYLNNTRIPFKHIWTPDIILYNSADKNFDPTTHTSVVVQHNGSCLYIPPGVFKSTCKINVSNFPFDKQNCTLKFGVWSYNGNQVDLQLQEEGGADTSEYTQSGEWRLIKLIAKRHSRKYDCCPENFVHVTFTVIIQRRTMFYIINLIIPCILNSILTLLTFFLPAEAAEKITLAITVLLAQIVFMLLIMETMPPTSDAVPIISKYFACSLFTVCASVAATVLVLSFYYTSPEIDGNLSPWMKHFLLVTAPKWLHMKPYTPKQCRHANALYVNKNNHRTRRNNKAKQNQQRSSRVEKGQYTNVEKDTCCERNLNYSSIILNPKLMASRNKPIECMTQIVNDYIIPQQLPLPVTDLRSPPITEAEPASATASNGGENLEDGKSRPDSYFTIEARQQAQNATQQQPESKTKGKGNSRPTKENEPSRELECLNEILLFLRKVNLRITEETIHNEVLLEWQFASRVLDKILLWIFLVFVVSATLTTLFAVPNIADAFAI